MSRFSAGPMDHHAMGRGSVLSGGYFGIAAKPQLLYAKIHPKRSSWTVACVDAAVRQKGSFGGNNRAGQS